MKKLGLIGYPLTHSFSASYFAEKFENEGIKGWEYHLYPLEDIEDLPDLLRKENNLTGLNVTIPHKVAVLDFLDELSPEAAAIGAVNTITIRKTGNSQYLKGYNTDCYGFEQSLRPLLKPWHNHALILGTGGAARAVAYILQKSGIEFQRVSRHESATLRYEDLTEDILRSHLLIINTTPLGTYPDVDSSPPIPYTWLGEKHILYDLVYNPAETLFLKKGREQGATTINGLRMLQLQAEKAWEIWQFESGKQSESE